MARCSRATLSSALIAAAAAIGCVDRSYVGGMFPGTGFQGGIVATLGESADKYSESPTFGIYYAGTSPGIWGLKSIPYETGFDVAWVETEDGRGSAAFYQLRFDCLFSRWGARGGRPDLYLLGGGGIVFAEVAGTATDSEVVAAVDLGMGLTSLRDRWDVRCNFSALVGSDNVASLLKLTGGCRF